MKSSGEFRSKVRIANIIWVTKSLTALNTFNRNYQKSVYNSNYSGGGGAVADSTLSPDSARSSGLVLKKFPLALFVENSVAAINASDYGFFVERVVFAAV